MDILTFLKQELIDQEEIFAEIIEISQVGSVLFCSRPHDSDYLVLCTNYQQRKNNIKVKEGDVIYDFFIYDIQEYRKKLTFDPSYRGLGTFGQYHNVQELLKIKVFGDAHIEWRIQDYREQYLSLLGESVYSLAFDHSRKYAYITGKNFVAPYMVLKFLDQGSTEITEAMKEDIKILRSGEPGFLKVIAWIGSRFGFSLVNQGEELS